MAIKFLHDLDLSGQEIQNLKLHVTGTPPTAAAGAIYFDSGANVVKVHDGTSFKTISTDTSDNVLTGLSFNTSTGVLTATLTDSSTVTVDLDGKYAESSHTHPFSELTSKPTTIDGYGITDAFDGAYSSLSGIPSTFTPASHTHAASDVTSGTFATARIPNLAASKITSGTLGTARIPDLAASKITSGTLGDSKIPSLAASKITSVTFDTARIPNLAASKISSGQVAVAQGGTGASTLDGAGIVTKTGTQTIGGAKTFSGNVAINGDLTVSGNQTTKNSEVVLIEDKYELLNAKKMLLKSTLWFVSIPRYSLISSLIKEPSIVQSRIILVPWEISIFKLLIYLLLLIKDLFF